MTEPTLLRIPTGATLPQYLHEVADAESWASAVCSGIGGVADVELAYYDLNSKSYLPFKVEGIVELVSLNGNLTRPGGEPFWHLHAVVADKSGRCYGGHLNSCTVALTIELAVWLLSEPRDRECNKELGLRLLRT